MAKKSKTEAVTVSFHYILPERDPDSLEAPIFSLEEYRALIKGLQNKPRIDMADKEAVKLLRGTAEAQIEDVSVHDERTAFGIFKPSYSGHSYENSDKGVISKDSVSLRKFSFMLYLSKSGKIYIGCQYLGQFGGYLQFSNTIKSISFSNKKYEFRSISVGASYFSNMKAKQIKVNISKVGRDKFSNPTFGSQAVVVFKKQHKDDGFELTVSDRLFPFMGQQRELKSAVAALASTCSLMSFSDEDVKDVAMVGDLNGKQKVIYMVGEQSFAYRYPLQVTLDRDGHPVRLEAHRKILEIFGEEILKKQEPI